MSFSTRTTYQGHAVNEGTKAILAAANKLVRSSTFGSETSDMTMMQGGYNKGGVAASAGTHDGGGAFDLTPFNWKNRVKVLRILGGASWHRPLNWDNRGGSQHIHTIVCGDGSASAGALAQVKDFYADKNGLANKAKDADWRPASLPILFHLPTGTDLAIRYAKANDTTMYDQPSTKGTKRGELAKGAKFTPVAMVKVGSVFWVINIDGKCVQHLSMTKTKPAATTKPAPAPAKKSVTLHIGNLNVCRNRITTDGKDWKAPSGLHITDVQKGKSWADRVKLIPGIQDALGVSILCTEESGQYVDGDLVDTELGASRWKNVLHGDPGDLTNAIHWASDKRKPIASGQFTTSGKTHNSATYVVFEDIGTGVRFVVVATHLLDKGSGSDADREKQTIALITGGEKIGHDRGDIPVIFVGDFNSDKDDAYDGPGKAFAAAGGYHEVDVAAKTSVHSAWATTNGLHTAATSGRRLDRAWVPEGCEVGSVITIFGAPATDHNGIGFSVTITA